MRPHEAHPPGPARLQLELPPEPGAPAAARRALRTLPLGDRAEDVLLLASELVTNAVVHAGAHGPILLVAEWSPGQTRVEVRDRRGFESSASVDGYGRQILDGASERWGVERDDGTAVWFEVG
jgi:two-component sensor histidine kinase